MKTRSSFFRLAVVVLALAVPTLAFAGSIGKPNGGGSSISWDLSVSGQDSIVLIVAHGDDVFTKTFKGGKPVVFNLRDMPSDVSVDGSYIYELRYVPVIPPGLEKKLAAARASNDEKASQKAFREAGIVVPDSQTGAFFVLNGSIVDPNAIEGGSAAKASAPLTTNGVVSETALRGPGSRFNPEVNDQVIPDDLIVQSSLCVGFDCVDGESFGTDTIRMKENNTRIKFDDTSTSAGFANNDWQITANDQPSGGSNKFSIDDTTNSKTPFTIIGNAPTNSVFIASTGKIGFRNSGPGLDLHMTTSDTPAIRFEQTNAGGFTAQTWDVAGNEANFFVRDLTGGSRLSFRIRPGAPTSSIDISASGDVGIGTASPDFALDVERTSGASQIRALASNSAGLAIIKATAGDGTTSGRNAFFEMGTSESAPQTWRFGMIGSKTFKITDASGVSTDRLIIDTSGNVGVATATPLSRFHVTGDVRVSSGSFIDDGVTLAAPDYVFDESYKLMSIDELSTFIKAEKHLPNVPSAVEFKKNGINLSKLGFALLEKVEELTLYTVAQHEQIGTLKSQNQMLLERLAALEAKVEQK